MSPKNRPINVSRQISSSSKKAGTRGGSKTNISVRAGPSQQRLARITAALDGERKTGKDSEQSASAMNCVPKEHDVFYTSQPCSTGSLLEPEIITDRSDESSYEESILQEKIAAEFESETPKSEEGNINKKSSFLLKEEAEMRRTVQVLFELEESLLDQHITNIKV